MDLAPQGARIFPLKQGSKVPQGGRGHLDARLVAVWKHDYFSLAHLNYGIALDGQWIVVDVDDPKALYINFYNYDTWTQFTKRGWHWLFKQPDGFKGKNVKLPYNAGDIKCHGYIVGPGSIVDGYEYTMDGSTFVADAPKWLLDLCQAPSSVLGLEVDKNSDDTELQVKEGEGRNQFLTRVAGSLRGLGIGAEQVKKLVRSTNGVVCQPPIGEAEMRATIDQSIEKWKQGEFSLDGPFVPAGWVSDIDVESIEEPISWWEWGFIPKNALVLQYGDGGIGKSTLVAWLAAKITRAGGRVGIVTREDPFRLFAIRARLSGSVPGQIFGVKNESRSEDAGAIVVGKDDQWSHCTKLVEEEGDPYYNLAKATLEYPYEQSIEKRAQWTIEQIKKSRADGVIFIHNWGCNTQAAISRPIVDFIKRETGIPTYIHERDLHGLRDEQEQNRVNAFIEML